MNKNYFWTDLKTKQKNVYERKLFLNDFKSERKLFWTKIILNDFKSEQKLFYT